MRPVPLIVASLFAIIGVEFLLEWWQPGEYFSPHVSVRIGGLGMNASTLLIPAIFIFAPTKSPQERGRGVRVLLAVLLSWYMTLAFRLQFHLPACRALARQSGDFDYDGIGMNAGLIVMGWLPPLIVSLVMILVLQVTTALIKQRVAGVRAALDETPVERASDQKVMDADRQL